MNPPYMQPQAGYGAPPANYGGSYPPMAGPMTPGPPPSGPGMMQPNQSQQYPANGQSGAQLPQQYGGPSMPPSGPPRIGLMPSSPHLNMSQPPLANQITQQMAGMSLDQSLKSPMSAVPGHVYPPANGIASPVTAASPSFHTPNPPRPAGGMPQQSLTPGLLPPRGPVHPSGPHQLGMSPYQNGPGDKYDGVDE